MLHIASEGLTTVLFSCEDLAGSGTMHEVNKAINFTRHNIALLSVKRSKRWNST